jgi:PhnB protein
VSRGVALAILPTASRELRELLPRITPHLVVNDAAGALDLYARAFGARETYRVLAPDGRRIMFAELVLCDSRFFVVDEFPEQRALSPTTLGGTPVALHVYVGRVDEVFERAVAAGMTVEIPVVKKRMELLAQVEHLLVA